MPRNKIFLFDKEIRAIIAKNLKRLTENMTQQELSEKTGIPASTLSGYFAERSTVNAGNLQKIADALGVTKADIDPRFSSIKNVRNALAHGLIDIYDTVGVKIPVYGSVAAGIPIEAITDILDYEEISLDLAATGEYFALKIKGDSMAPRISDGDVVIVKRQNTVENKQVAIVLVNGDEATIKEVQFSDTGLTLVGWNVAAYQPHFFTKEEVENLPVKIIGKVVELRGKFY